MTATILQFSRMAQSSDQLPNRIRFLREAKGWTQTELAERMGLSYTMVGRVETGVRPLSLERMKQFAKALECDTGDLLLVKDNPQGLSSEELRLIGMVREGGPLVQRMVIGVAEQALEFAAGPARIAPRRA